MAYSITPMNCRTLLQHLREGGSLRTHWVYGKRLNILRLANGGVLYIQASNVKALLKSRAIRSILFSGDNYEYYLAPAKDKNETFINPSDVSHQGA